MDIKYPKPSAPRILQVILVLFKQKSDQKKVKACQRKCYVSMPSIPSYCILSLTLFVNESILDINYPELLTPVYQYMI